MLSSSIKFYNIILTEMHLELQGSYTHMFSNIQTGHLLVQCSGDIIIWDVNSLSQNNLDFERKIETDTVNKEVTSITYDHVNSFMVYSTLDGFITVIYIDKENKSIILNKIMLSNSFAHMVQFIRSPYEFIAVGSSGCVCIHIINRSITMSPMVQN